jgi:2-C-methyl-D-erythritol 4-phosphate cytidylyltransferase
MRRLALLGEEREIILAVHPEDRETHLAKLLDSLRGCGLDQIVNGGKTRLESMRLALAASNNSYPLVMVHDAARPFFSVSATEEAMRQARDVGAALLAAPAPDTLKRADGKLVGSTIDRSNVWLAQTPQVMRRDLLDKALEIAAAEQFECTDDVSLFEHAGFPVALVASSHQNLKVTNAEDLALAELIAQKEQE